MKGLLIKDLLLLKQTQRRSLLVVVILCVFYAANDMGSFAVPFLGFLTMTIATGTFSFDEAENGNHFLFTLPFSRKEYVAEKYLLSMAWTLAGILVGIGLYVFSEVLTNNSVLISEVSFLFFGFLLFFFLIDFVNLPIMIRFGAERGRMMFYLCFMALFIVAYLGFKYGAFISAESLAARILSIPLPVRIIVPVLITAGAGYLSFSFSVSLMCNKEF